MRRHRLSLRPLWPLLLAVLAAGAGALPRLDSAAKDRIESVPARETGARLALIKPALDAAQSVDDRVWLLDRLAAAQARERQWQASLTSAREGLVLARTPAERARFTTLAGWALLFLKRSEEALQSYEQLRPQVVELARAADRESQLLAADVRRVGGNAMAQLGRLPEAMELLSQALRTFDAWHDPVRQADSLNEIAMTHFVSGRPEEAITTEQRAIDTLQTSGSDGPLSHYYLRRSHFQSQLGQTDAQEQSLLLGERHARAEGDSFYLAVAATNLADVALQRKDYVRALRYANEAIPLVEANKDSGSLAVSWVNRGIALNRLHREGGIGWIERGQELMSTIPGQQLDTAVLLGVLAEEHAFNGDFERAYAAAQRFRQLESEQRKVTDMKRMANAAAAYQADRKQRQIEQLQGERETLQRFRLLWVLIGVIGVGLALVLVMGRRKLRKAYRAMEEMALQDPLTGLKNRRFLMTHIDGELAQLHRQQQKPARGEDATGSSDMAFLMIDMDHFKSVNDTHGHAAGDAVLMQMAAILRGATREADRVVRWGGEEFLVVAQSTVMNEVHLLAERIRSRVEEHGFDIGSGHVLRMTCSIGFAGCPLFASSQRWAQWESVVSLADQCLYRVKQSGRNSWLGALAGVEMSQVSVDLEQAVSRGQVRLVEPTAQHAQPQQELQAA